MANISPTFWWIIFVQALPIPHCLHNLATSIKEICCKSAASFDKLTWGSPVWFSDISLFSAYSWQCFIFKWWSRFVTMQEFMLWLWHEEPQTIVHACMYSVHVFIAVLLMTFTVMQWWRMYVWVCTILWVLSESLASYKKYKTMSMLILHGGRRMGLWRQSNQRPLVQSSSRSQNHGHDGSDVSNSTISAQG